MGKDNRQKERHKTLGLMSFLSDGQSSVLGVVEDLSATGLRVSQVPLDFDDAIGECKAVINCPITDYPGGDFTIVLKPRWTKITNPGMYKPIGFQIVHPPDGWKKFVTELESGTSELGFLILSDDEDLWSR